jgi:hypothetical protein
VSSGVTESSGAISLIFFPSLRETCLRARSY